MAQLGWSDTAGTVVDLEKAGCLLYGPVLTARCVCWSRFLLGWPVAAGADFGRSKTGSVFLVLCVSLLIFAGPSRS